MPTKMPKITPKITKEKREKFENLQCSMEATLAVIGGKYKINILYALCIRTMCYNEIAKFIPKATPKMLSTQLKELESDELITRTLYPVVPPKTEYSLTTLGKSLCPIIEALSHWGDAYFSYLGIENRCEREKNAGDK